MALKRQNDMMATFSMASMTDVVFLLLIFFMVTSTYVFPTALEVNLPKSSQQTTLKPSIQVYLDAEGGIAAKTGDDPEAMAMAVGELPVWLKLAVEQDPENPYVAVYADESLPYGKIVDILNIGAAIDIKMVLATKPSRNPEIVLPLRELQTPTGTPEVSL